MNMENVYDYIMTKCKKDNEALIDDWKFDIKRLTFTAIDYFS